MPPSTPLHPGPHLSRGHAPGAGWSGEAGPDRPTREARGPGQGGRARSMGARCARVCAFRNIDGFWAGPTWGVTPLCPLHPGPHLRQPLLAHRAALGHCLARPAQRRLVRRHGRQLGLQQKKEGGIGDVGRGSGLVVQGTRQGRLVRRHGRQLGLQSEEEGNMVRRKSWQVGAPARSPACSATKEEGRIVDEEGARRGRFGGPGRGPGLARPPARPLAWSTIGGVGGGGPSRNLRSPTSERPRLPWGSPGEQGCLMRRAGPAGGSGGHAGGHRPPRQALGTADRQPQNKSCNQQGGALMHTLGALHAPCAYSGLCNARWATPGPPATAISRPTPRPSQVQPSPAKSIQPSQRRWAHQPNANASVQTPNRRNHPPGASPGSG